MAKTGKTTATDASDFFSQLVTFLTGDSATPGRDWTIVKDYRPTLERVVISNTGLSGTEEIYVGLSNEIKSDMIDAGLVCKVYYQFNPSGIAETEFFDQVYGNDDNGNHNFVPYWHDQFSFWVWSNQQRIIIVTKTGDKYGNAYLGMMHRFIPPTEYQFPLVCFTDARWSSWSSYYPYSQLSNRESLIYISTSEKPGCRIQTPLRTWITNWQLIPTQGNYTQTYGDGDTRSESCRGIQSVLYKDAEPRAVLPIYLKAWYGDVTAILGELDGVFYCPGTFLTAETVLDSSYVVFPNINRTEWYNWMAIKDE